MWLCDPHPPPCTPPPKLESPSLAERYHPHHPMYTVTVCTHIPRYGPALKMYIPIYGNGCLPGALSFPAPGGLIITPVSRLDLATVVVSAGPAPDPPFASSTTPGR